MPCFWYATGKGEICTDIHAFDCVGGAAGLFAAEKNVSGRLGIPSLLMFILLGMLFGSDGLFKIHFDDYAFAEQISSVALVFIMFYGGFGTNWKAARPVAALSVVLSSAGTVLTALLTGAVLSF